MIIDSSSLIIFAKINRLEILSKLYHKINITKGIYKEVVEQGLLVNAPDSRIVKEHIEDKKIELMDLNEKYEKFSKNLRGIYYQLGIGESDAISLALQEKNNCLIIDEKIGRSVCKLYNLKPIGTLRVLLEAYKRDIIKEMELREIIREMTKHNFRVGADVISEFWLLFEKLKKRKHKL